MIRKSPDDKAANLTIRRVLRVAGRWVAEHIESVPIPIYQQLWSPYRPIDLAEDLVPGERLKYALLFVDG